ncbi:DinB family protein [Desulfocurvibacter africanus]|uniref:DinB family protein n=1 Tax=Desulfocurvibacter africanus TaxID=873 RepID=UPI00040AA586|nr:DinB family protein [Desulfocurvibacter africanus]
MQADSTLRKELLTLLRGGHAHMSPDEVLADFPLDQMNAKPPNSPYSCWHILEHMRITLWDIVEFIRNPEHISPEYPEGYRPRPEARTDATGWRSSAEWLLGDLAALEKMVRDPRIDLFAPIAHAPDYTVFREVLTAADHLAYHTGELAMMRQVLNLWPKGSEYLTG